MNLCADCIAAESDPLPLPGNSLLCCRVRDLFVTPRRFRRDATAALKSGLNPIEWADALARIEVLKAREQANKENRSDPVLHR